MPRTRTLAELQAEVRQRADVENDPHISDAELIRFINQSCTALHALLCDVNEGYMSTSATWTTVAGTESVTVSKDPLSGIDNNFYKLLNVEVSANGLWGKLGRATDEERTRRRGYPGIPRGYQMKRASDGGVVLLMVPVPDAAYSLVVTYVAAFADLVSGTDKFDGADGWEEWVVLDAAIKCLIKGEESIVDMTRERDRVETRIKAQLATPDLDHPPVVRDTSNDGGMDLPDRWLRGGW